MLDKKLLLEVLSNVKYPLTLQVVIAHLSGDRVDFYTTAMGKELLLVNRKPVANIDALIKENILEVRDNLTLLKRGEQ